MKKTKFIIVLKSAIILLTSLMLLQNICYAQKNKVSIRIMAAASLTESFNKLKNEFEIKYPDIKVEINYAGSQQLVTQIEQGVNADVFASANEEYMDKLAAENLVNKHKVFAHNEKNIKSLNDLAKSGIKLDIASPSVPVGKYTLEMLNKIRKTGKFPSNYKQNFLKNVITEELNVKSVLTKVELGEADAGIIYKTDLTPESLKKVKIISIDDKYNVIKDSKNKQQANTFMNYVLSDSGRKVFRKYGFMR